MGLLRSVVLLTLTAAVAVASLNSFTLHKNRKHRDTHVQGQFAAPSTVQPTALPSSLGLDSLETHSDESTALSDAAIESAAPAAVHQNHKQFEVVVIPDGPIDQPASPSAHMSITAAEFQKIWKWLHKEEEESSHASPETQDAHIASLEPATTAVNSSTPSTDEDVEVIKEPSQGVLFIESLTEEADSLLNPHFGHQATTTRTPTSTADLEQIHPRRDPSTDFIFSLMRHDDSELNPQFKAGYQAPTYCEWLANEEKTVPRLAIEATHLFALKRGNEASDRAALLYHQEAIANATTKGVEQTAAAITLYLASLVNQTDSRVLGFVAQKLATAIGSQPVCPHWNTHFVGSGEWAFCDCSTGGLLRREEWRDGVEMAQAYATRMSRHSQRTDEEKQYRRLEKEIWSCNGHFANALLLLIHSSHGFRSLDFLRGERAHYWAAAQRIDLTLPHANSMERTCELSKAIEERADKIKSRRVVPMLELLRASLSSMEDFEEPHWIERFYQAVHFQEDERKSLLIRSTRT